MVSCRRVNIDGFIYIDYNEKDLFATRTIHGYRTHGYTNQMIII